MWLDCDDPDLNRRCDRAQIWRPADLRQFARHVLGDDGRHALLIDCSANDEVAAHYAGWLAEGVHVVTPNKLAGSGPLDRWQAIRAASHAGARFRYEATVCAGLPVVQTLRDLLDTGDELLAVDGMSQRNTTASIAERTRPPAVPGLLRLRGNLLLALVLVLLITNGGAG